MILTFLVRHQTLSLVDTKMEPRQGSANYLQLKFIFATPDWKDLRKTLHLSSGEYSEPFVLESDVFDVPEYYTQQSSFDVTLLGDAGNQLVPTNVLEVSLSESNHLWTAKPPDPQNSAYIQLMGSIGNLPDLETQAKDNLVAAINELTSKLYAYNFTVVNALSNNPKDAEALNYVIRNWGNVVMSVYVQGYPVIELVKDNHQIKVHYKDNSVCTFNWWISGDLKSCRLSVISKRQLAEKGYVDEEISKNKKQIDSVESHIDTITDTPKLDRNRKVTISEDGTKLIWSDSEDSSDSAAYVYLYKGDILDTRIRDSFTNDGAVFYEEDGKYYTHSLLVIDKFYEEWVPFVAPYTGSYAVHMHTSPVSNDEDSIVYQLYVSRAFTRDNIIEQGRLNGWYYRKWSNGDAECWRNITATVKTTDWIDSGMMSIPLLSDFGLFWTRDIKIQFDYPFEFELHPVETATLANGTVWFPLSMISTTAQSTTKTDSYRICTYKQPGQDIGVKIALHVSGKWKQQ